MALKDEIQKWLSEHPDATAEEAIWQEHTSKSTYGATKHKTKETMKTEENKRMLALSYIVADLKAENMELAQRVHQLMDDYNDVVRQLDGKETHKGEDPARLLLGNMQKMRDHCDKLEKENRELERFAKAIICANKLVEAKVSLPDNE